MTPKELSDIRRKLKVLNYAKEIGNAAAACRRFGISGETFYKWKRAYARDGERALINSKPCPERNPSDFDGSDLVATYGGLKRFNSSTVCA